MRICITGALGHLGAALLCSFREDDQILAIDNLSSNHHAVLFKSNLACEVRFVQDDILYADLPKLLAGQDVVIHLAAITDAAHSHLNKEEIENVNFIGAEKVGLACAEAGAKMLFPSSTSVYGVDDGLVDESSAVRPQSPYAWSKFNAERALQSTPNLQVSILRLATIYGLSMGGRFHTAVNQFAWNAATNQPLEVWRSAWSQYRPYLFIGDAVRAMQHVIDQNLFDGQIYNVLTGNHTVSEIVGQIQRHRPGLTVNLVDSPIMNQLSYETSCEKFKATGWHPVGNLECGIAQEMDWLSWVSA
jgi:UDP-glucose 4-epimerase